MRHTLEDLLTLMAVLRDREQGCPWDIQQDWDSIVPHTLEEAYEVADAIERRAFDELPGELGDSRASLLPGGDCLLVSRNVARAPKPRRSP